MATAAVTPTTTANLNKIWRKVQMPVRTAWNFLSDEWEMIGDLDEYDVDWSTRSIEIPLDINEDAGVASIPEGGHEARPMSPNAEELSLNFIWLNKRFTVTHHARAIDQRSKNAMLVRQFGYQIKKAQQAIARTWSDQFYGYSNGTQCLTTTVDTQTSDTFSLIDAYGDTTIDDADFIIEKFRVNDWVALIRSAALVTNAIGQVTARRNNGGSGELDVTWNGSVTSASGDAFVMANSIENTTITGTSYNNHLVGLLDGQESTSVHGLSGATVANWNAAYSDSAATRFSGIKLQRAAHEIRNKGGGKLNLAFMSQGVERDLIDYYRGGLRISSPFEMEVDGSVKSKSVKFVATKRVPPGHVRCLDSRSLKKGMLLGKPGAPMWADGDKIEGRSATAFSMDLPCFLVHLNRGNYAWFKGQTES